MTTCSISCPTKSKFDADLRANQEASCPCCGRLVKIYRRKLNSGLSRCMIWLVSEYRKTKTWVDVTETCPRHVLSSSSDRGLLIHWKLIEKKENYDDSKRTSGIWIPTQKGMDFVDNKISVPSHVVLVDNKVIGWSDEQVKITRTLGSKFNYTELMQLKGY